MSDSFVDPYTYPNSTTLRNLLDEPDPERLLAAEYEFTLYRRRELLTHPIKGVFDLKRLRETHRRLFQDVYPWAGAIRTVNISKGSSHFHTASLIGVAAEDTFAWLKTTDLLPGSRAPRKSKLDDQSFVEQSSDLLERLNYIHPFREGNGRTQRAFLDQVAAQSGHSLAWRNVSRIDHLRASIDAFNQASSAPFHSVMSQVIQPPLDGLSLLDDELYVVSNASSTVSPADAAPASRGLAERMRKFPELFASNTAETQSDAEPER